MRRRALSPSGPDVSVVGFGCGRTAALMVGTDREAQQRTVSTAIDIGVDYFDTAPSYGSGRSEENLGRTLLELGVRSHITTKVGLGPGDLDDIPGAVRRSIEGSLMRLKAEHLTGVILHNRVALVRDETVRIGPGPLLGIDDVLGDRGVVSVLDSLVREAIIEVKGFTALGGDRSAIELLIHSGAFDVVNVLYNLNNMSAGRSLPPSPCQPDYWQIIDMASEKGLAVLVIRALAAGSLTHGDQRDSRSETIDRLARDLGESVATLAIRYTLSKPGVSSVIVGFSHPDHVQDAYEAERLPPLSADELAELEEAVIGTT